MKTLMKNTTIQILTCLLLAGVTPRLSAAIINQAAGTGAPGATIGYNSAIWGSPTAAVPTALNDYVGVAGLTTSGQDVIGPAYTSTIRALDSASPYIFQGNSLTVPAGVRILLKMQENDSAIVTNLTLNGGYVVSARNGPNAGTVTLGGAINVAGNSTIGVNQTSPTHTILNVTSAITGSGTLNLALGNNATNGIILSGNMNGFTGNLVCSLSASAPPPLGTFTIATAANLASSQLTIATTSAAMNFNLVSNLTVNSLIVGTVVIPVGTHTATDLNTLSSTAVFLGAASITVLTAPIYVWNGTPNGNWDINNTTNWKLSGSSVAWPNGAISRFDDSATGTTTVNQTTLTAPGSLTVSNSALSYTFTGIGSITGVPLIKQGVGTLTVLSSNTFAANSQIQQGTVIFNGNANTVAGENVASTDNSTGTLMVTNGARLTVGPLSLGTGLSANGAMTVAGSSILTNNGAIVVAQNTSSIGSLVLQDNATEVVTTGDYVVGQFGSSLGTLVITNNAQVLYGSPGNWVRIGLNANATGTINQSGGAFTMLPGSGEFHVGDSGNGTWNLSGGTVKTLSVTSVGRYTGSAGTLNVSGGIFDQAGSGNQLTVGETGNGTLNLSAPGVVNVEGSGGLVVGLNGGSSGTVNLNGGTLIAKQVVGSATGSSLFYFNGGTLKAGPGAYASFMSYIGGVYVSAGGAMIDSDTNNIAIASTVNDNGGGGLAKLGGGSLTFSGDVSYTGPTLVSAGTLGISTHFYNNNSILVSDGAQLALQVRDFQGSQIAPASLTLGAAGATALNFDLGAFGNPPVGYAPISLSGNLVNNSAVTVNIADALPQVGQFPLIKYNHLVGTGSFVVGTLPVGVQAAIVINSANSTIDLNITAVNLPRWEGLAGGNWDLGVTTNWVDRITGLPTTFNQGNTALFDDEALGTSTVNLVATVNPGSVLVSNNVINYAFIGSGKISGTTGLTKTGTAVLTNATASDYTGPTALQGGTLVANTLANLGSASSIGAGNLSFAGGALSYTGPNVSINRGYALAPGGGTLTIQSNLTLSGAITATGGNFIKSGPASLTYNSTASNTLAGGVFPGYQVMAGTVVFDGSGGQTNSNPSDFWVGTAPANGANLILTNTTLNVGAYFIVGNSNGSVGNVSTATFYNSALTSTRVFAGQGDPGSGNVTTQAMTLYGNSSMTINGRLVMGANAGSTSTLLVADNAAIKLIGTVLSSIGESGNAVATFKNNATYSGTNANDFNVAELGSSQGTLNLQDNAQITASSVYVGKAAGCVGTVNQMGGSFTGNVGGNSEFQIGVNGQGAWNQSGGANNAAGYVCIGRQTGGIGTLTVSGGVFNQTGTGTGLIVGEAGTGTLTIANTGIVTTASTGLGLTLGLDVGGAGTVNLNGGTIATLLVQGTTNGSSTFNFNGGVLQAGAGANTNFMSGLTTANILAGGAVINSAGNNIAIGQALLGTGPDGGLTKMGAGGLNLNGINTYTNTTTVTAGSLGGIGYLSGPVVVQAGGTLTAGTYSGIGTLNLLNNLTLGGNVFAKLNKSSSPSNDLVQVSGMLINTGTGTVMLTNQGPALVVGDSFKLFSQPVINGNTLTVVSSGGGVVWTNKLAMDGTVQVLSVGGGVPPQFAAGAVMRLPDGNISLTATGGIGTTYKLWATTNLALTPISSTWTLLNSGTVTVTPFTVSDLTATNYPHRFYLFSTP
jgi:fibronectin-binding autotransporter adhesin